MRSSWRRRLPFMDLCGPWWALLKEAPMAVNVKLPEALVETAKRYGALEHRSVPKQI